MLLQRCIILMRCQNDGHAHALLNYKIFSPCISVDSFEIFNPNCQYLPQLLFIGINTVETVPFDAHPRILWRCIATDIWLDANCGEQCLLCLILAGKSLLP